MIVVMIGLTLTIAVVGIGIPIIDGIVQKQKWKKDNKFINNLKENKKK